MQQTGVKLVRLAEFAWSKISPREGMYDQIPTGIRGHRCYTNKIFRGLNEILKKLPPYSQENDRRNCYLHRKVKANQLATGWMDYLASVMDLHSKKIIGYAYDTSMTAELVTQEVKNACLNVKVTEGIILHSDLGIIQFYK